MHAVRAGREREGRVDKALKAGASALLPFQDLGEMGAIGIFSDPTGCSIGVWEAKQAPTAKKQRAPAKKAAAAAKKAPAPAKKAAAKKATAAAKKEAPMKKKAASKKAAAPAKKATAPAKNRAK